MKRNLDIQYQFIIVRQKLFFALQSAKIFLAGFVMVFALCCREPYNPPSIQNPPSYLVVDGFINNGDSTVITLSRSHSLNDSVSHIPETGAKVVVVGSAADIYPLTENVEGVYSVDALPLNPSETYQVQITTRDGKQYASDMVPVTQTPPIDSVNWIYNENLGVSFYVNTHDPQNNTRFYRWTYTETWEYHAAWESYLIYVDGEVLPRTDQIFRCWSSHNSTELLLANSQALSKDVIYEYPIQFVPQGDLRFTVKYSIVVRQYALTMEAYDYWQNIKKNSELTGSIFAPQPFETQGNIHCVSNPGEPVLGYMSVSSLQQQRIFITHSQLSGWQYQYPDCMTIQTVTPDSTEFYFGRLGYTPLGMAGVVNYTGIRPACGDCRTGGGTNIEPSFWE